MANIKIDVTRMRLIASSIAQPYGDFHESYFNFGALYRSNVKAAIEKIKTDKFLDPEAKQNKLIEFYNANKELFNARNSAILLSHLSEAVLSNSVKDYQSSAKVCIELARNCVKRENDKHPDAFPITEALYHLSALGLPVQSIFAKAARRLVHFPHLSPHTIEKTARCYAESLYRPERLLKYLALSAYRAADKFDLEGIAGLTMSFARCNFSHERFQHKMGDKIWELLKDINDPHDLSQKTIGNLAFGSAVFEKVLGKAIWDTLIQKYEELYPTADSYVVPKEADRLTLQQFYESGLALGRDVPAYMKFATWENLLMRNDHIPSHSAAENDISSMLSKLSARFNIDFKRNQLAGGYIVDFLVTFSHPDREVKIALDVTGKYGYILEDPTNNKRLETGGRRIRRSALENLGYHILEIDKHAWNGLLLKEKNTVLENAIGRIITFALNQI